jgi:hypothetical protein
MAADQLLDDRAQGIVDRKLSAFSGDLREEDPLEDVVADLLLERSRVAPLDRIDHFVRLFEDEVVREPSVCSRSQGIPLATAVTHGHQPLNASPVCDVWFVVSSDSAETPMPDPNINFASFVLSLAATAAVHFGDRLEPGETEQGPVDLQAAGQMIDILALLEEKTRGNLTAEERQLLETILYELRMRFIEAQGGEKRIITP